MLFYNWFLQWVNWQVRTRTIQFCLRSRPHSAGDNTRIKIWQGSTLAKKLFWWISWICSRSVKTLVNRRTQILIQTFLWALIHIFVRKFFLHYYLVVLILSHTFFAVIHRCIFINGLWHVFSRLFYISGSATRNFSERSPFLSQSRMRFL